MDKRNCVIGAVEKINVEKCVGHEVARGVDNSNKVKGQQKEVRFSDSNEPPKTTEKILPKCRVRLTRCDGLISSDSSLGVVMACGNHGGDSTLEKTLVTSDKMKPDNEPLETNSAGPSRKPTSKPANPTQVETKQHICHLYSKSFGNLGNLKRHARIHTGERPHHCQICSKSFGQLENLNSHMRTHTGEMPYKCKLCSKPFRVPGNLKTHTRTHTGERPYQCLLCTKSFGYQGDLKRHIRSHTGERPYKCELCSKSFGRKYCLNKHIRTHTGELPHQCQICSKSFGQLSNLNRHIRTHATGCDVATE